MAIGVSKSDAGTFVYSVQFQDTPLYSGEGFTLEKAKARIVAWLKQQ